MPYSGTHDLIHWQAFLGDNSEAESRYRPCQRLKKYSGKKGVMLGKFRKTGIQCFFCAKLVDQLWVLIFLSVKKEGNTYLQTSPGFQSKETHFEKHNTLLGYKGYLWLSLQDRFLLVSPDSPSTRWTPTPQWFVAHLLLLQSPLEEWVNHGRDSSWDLPLYSVHLCHPHASFFFIQLVLNSYVKLQRPTSTCFYNMHLITL